MHLTRYLAAAPVWTRGFVITLGTALGAALSGCAVLEDLSRSAPPASAAEKGAVEKGAAETSTAESNVTAVDIDTSLSGRLSLRVRKTSDGSTDGGSLLFEFQGRESQGRLTLQTPIGTALAQVEWSPEGAEVITPQGRRKGPNLDAVSSVLLGESLPIAALLKWFQAEPWEGAPFKAHADGFEQLGWTISLAAWNERLVTAHRPARVDRVHDTEVFVRARLDPKPGTNGFHPLQP